ncbi:hypothetical protein IWQ61_008981 [Dispira simplex]|nr:hypothetical protein IWQ61_008981 [Dispira simplex]
MTQRDILDMSLDDIVTKNQRENRRPRRSGGRSRRSDKPYIRQTRAMDVDDQETSRADERRSRTSRRRREPRDKKATSSISLARVLVQPLALGIDEDSIESEFRQVGPVRMVHLVGPYQAVVEYMHENDAQQAVTTLDGERLSTISEDPTPSKPSSVRIVGASSVFSRLGQPPEDTRPAITTKSLRARAELRQRLGR